MPINGVKGKVIKRRMGWKSDAVANPAESAWIADGRTQVRLPTKAQLGSSLPRYALPVPEILKTPS